MRAPWLPRLSVWEPVFAGSDHPEPKGILYNMTSVIRESYANSDSRTLLFHS